MFKKVAISIVVLVLGFLLYVSTQPNTFMVERSIEVNVPVEKIFPLVNDLKNWSNWSPYEKLDSKATMLLSENTVGVGAYKTWDGNFEVGQGKMEITQSKINEEVQFKLSMTKPFNCINEVIFSFMPQGDATVVTWNMSGEVKFVPKILHALFDMNKMVGGQFEEGLRNLKTLAEQLDRGGVGGVVVPRKFNASLADVWNLWATSENIKKWWGPEFYTAPRIKSDFKENGKFLFSMMGPDKKVFWNSGTYKQIVPQKKIVMVMYFSDEAGKPLLPKDIGLPGEWADEVTVTIDFSEVDGKTQIVVKERGIPPEMTKHASLGWLQQFDKMDDILD